MKLISCIWGGNSYTDASCGFEVLPNENKVPSFLPFTAISWCLKFFFNEMKMENANNDEIEQLQGPTKEALLCLIKFYKTKLQGEFVNMNSF